jgi:phage gp36-like protein
MAYITNEDIEARLGADAYVQLTDDAGSGVADENVVTEARLGAEGEMNSHLARRFRAPIDVTAHPELKGLLVSVALDLAEYRLRMRRPPVAEDMVRRRREAIDWLEAVAAGRVELPATSALPSSSSASGAASVGNERVLSRDEMSDY